jgi:hypothetical protein
LKAVRHAHNDQIADHLKAVVHVTRVLQDLKAGRLKSAIRVTPVHRVRREGPLMGVEVHRADLIDVSMIRVRHNQSDM